MSFGNPWLLLTLLALPVLVVLHRRVERRRVRYAVRFTNLDVLASVAQERSWRRAVVPILLLLALAALAMGAARPHRQALVPTEQATVILVLDVSRSMESDDIKPTRLGAAQQAIRLFLDRVPKKVRVGLILFAGEPHVAVPPTTDRDPVRQSLDFAESFSGFGGTAIGDALDAAVTLARQTVPGIPTSTVQTIAFTSSTPSSPVTILFLSDGHQTRGVLQPLEGAQRAKVAEIPVYTISLGTPGGTLDRGQFGAPGGFGGGRLSVAPDPATLRAIAQTTGGKFFAARSTKALRAAYTSLGSHLGRVRAQQELTARFVLLAALLLAAAGIVSRPWAPKLP
ncbi:MAG: Ca-activated chloride channel [Gaiellaceae bacterium]|nr:Ca-activated chloride channel [Gaiellaceae bacterium]